MTFVFKENSKYQLILFAKVHTFFLDFRVNRFWFRGELPYYRILTRIVKIPVNLSRAKYVQRYFPRH